MSETFVFVFHVFTMTIIIGKIFVGTFSKPENIDDFQRGGILLQAIVPFKHIM